MLLTGALQLGSAITTGAGSSVDVSAGATLDLGGFTLNTSGDLTVNGTLSGGSIALAGGQTLKGAGTITGSVTVADGATVSPGNSPGTLTTGTLVLNDATVLDFQLDGPGPNDMIAVTGDLTLDGILNVADLGGLEVGQYTLLTYTGSLTDNGLTLGTLPGAFTYSITNTGSSNGSVILNVSIIPEPATLGLLSLGGLMMLKRRRHSA